VRFTEINLFGRLCRADVVDDGLSPGWRPSDCAARFGLTQYVLLAQRICAALRLRRRRRRVGMINPVISAAYGRSREALWRLPNRRAILRRPPFVSRRFQCRMTASGAELPMQLRGNSVRSCAGFWTPAITSHSPKVGEDRHPRGRSATWGMRGKVITLPSSARMSALRFRLSGEPAN
jgi:hypothetical protein